MGADNVQAKMPSQCGSWNWNAENTNAEFSMMSEKAKMEETFNLMRSGGKKPNSEVSRFLAKEGVSKIIDFAASMMNNPATAPLGFASFNVGLNIMKHFKKD